ncbi:glutamyl-tRNA reductase [Spirosomataceae bacterium TFI 002]|nr:glutamyl-tRNA reductase [Spirosomataceae bacterium TFI 002]
MQGSLKVLSISYKNTPLTIREQIALSEAEIKSMYLKLKDVLGLSEVVILSTCNRTEVYYLADIDIQETISKLLAIEKGLSYDKIAPFIIYYNNEQDALNYLFEVGTGLHSQVVGDLQLPNQIKNAYQWSADAEMAGPFIHRLMHTVFFVNKRVFQETSFRDGAASTSYAAVETIESFLPLIPDAKILVLGLGDVGKDVSKTLFDKGYKGFTICNRTSEKADRAANSFESEVLDFSELYTALPNYDIIISSVQANEPILKVENFKNIKNGKVKYLIDLSIPRSIDPEVENLSGVVLYGLDEIQQRASEALERRKESIPTVKSIIAEAVEGLNDWSEQMVVSPTIQKLKVALEKIRKEEMAKYMKGLSEEEAGKVEKITTSMMQKVMKLPVLQLKAACKRGEADTLIDVLNDLFDLEKVNV